MDVYAYMQWLAAATMTGLAVLLFAIAIGVLYGMWKDM
jgi:cytochrome c1